MTSSCPPPLLLLTHWPTRHAEPRASFHSTCNAGQPDRTNMTGLRNNSILAMVVLLLTATWWHADRTRVMQGLLPCNDQRARGCLHLGTARIISVLCWFRAFRMRWRGTVTSSENESLCFPCHRCTQIEAELKVSLGGPVSPALQQVAQRLSAWCSPPRACRRCAHQRSSQVAW